MGKFTQWIKKEGPIHIASQLGVTPHSVRFWVNRVSTPNTGVAMKLVKLGKGEFDHNDIVNDTYRKKIRGKAKV